MNNCLQTQAAARNYQPIAADFENRVILVTGSTQGLGLAIATALVDSGAQVILHGRNARKLDGVHQDLLGRGIETSVAQLDFERAQGDEYMRLTEEIDRRFGRLDGLVHNAAILGDRSPIEHYDIAVWQRVMHVNVTAPFILTRCLLPLLRQSGDASVVSTTSGVGNQARAHWGAYCVSKFGLEAFAELLALEHEHDAIRSNIVNPGKTRTNMRRKAYPGEDPATLPVPEALTGPFLYLLGSASKGVTGKRIDIQSY